ncbi:hypothetical protein SODALDRAFT_320422 [Sodiomyces alkalinus F11]|uniref:MARVEL domain-containing protein n=1 Tax=Sodiomyces alkalinus (strain CBS 110278 / VKM F-3762 / F11) TaxID=1314773 RepID=A0A3N2PN79_SODAK|nr:hypothetical protein SODALDRAFT_320422 [Sodiomyces alkalinus F11]ROT35949.1 hypothetical protein SODALDRAFT_320422 [Sodiomyces alkalinus F11]
MTGLRRVTLGTWILQIIFAIVVLGLCTDLMNTQRRGEPPITTKYGVFAGVFGLVAAVLGLVALFVDAIPASMVVFLDAASALIFLAGGIAYTVGLKGIRCEFEDNKMAEKLYEHSLVGLDVSTDVLSNCRKATASQAMQFVTSAVALITVSLGFLAQRDRQLGNQRRAHV